MSMLVDFGFLVLFLSGLFMILSAFADLIEGDEE